MVLTLSISSPDLDVTRYYRNPNSYHQRHLHPYGNLSTYPSWPYGVAGCVVEVDPATGLIRILRYCYVHDAGNIVNPMPAEGNMHGGFAQGIGGALYESLAYDEAGQLTTTTFFDCILPMQLTSQSSRSTTSAHRRHSVL